MKPKYILDLNYPRKEAYQTLRSFSFIIIWVVCCLSGCSSRSYLNMTNDHLVIKSQNPEDKTWSICMEKQFDKSPLVAKRFSAQSKNVKFSNQNGDPIHLPNRLSITFPIEDLFPQGKVTNANQIVWIRVQFREVNLLCDDRAIYVSRASGGFDNSLQQLPYDSKAMEMQGFVYFTMDWFSERLLTVTIVFAPETRFESNPLLVQACVKESTDCQELYFTRTIFGLVENI